jgi:hypothetical protein
LVGSVKFWWFTYGCSFPHHCTRLLHCTTAPPIIPLLHRCPSRLLPLPSISPRLLPHHTTHTTLFPCSLLLLPLYYSLSLLMLLLTWFLLYHGGDNCADEPCVFLWPCGTVVTVGDNNLRRGGVEGGRWEVGWQCLFWACSLCLPAYLSAFSLPLSLPLHSIHTTHTCLFCHHFSIHLKTLLTTAPLVVHT